MSEKKARMGAAGRVLIPAGVRRAMQVSEGDPLIIVEVQEGILLLTPEQAARRAQRLVQEHVPSGRRLSEELIAERRAEVKRG